ncbi:hypothetical protein K469DRAFT_703308 [Zopfia rhizophila CBS 207.26]|uniref:Uncharacterized protein n=1 Tax=Zopfia rhizophila CBS 207.26 TaxID=1314779 RepID=A0A6A6EDT5_9PEZI|nr:hypothetical protein K469DRAFT_703308 [Zopfia rhizophila CBS 207.26]
MPVRSRSTGQKRKLPLEVCDNCHKTFPGGFEGICTFHPGHQKSVIYEDGGKFTYYSCCGNDISKPECNLGSHIAKHPATQPHHAKQPRITTGESSPFFSHPRKKSTLY